MRASETTNGPDLLTLCSRTLPLQASNRLTLFGVHVTTNHAGVRSGEVAAVSGDDAAVGSAVVMAGTVVHVALPRRRHRDHHEDEEEEVEDLEDDPDSLRYKTDCSAKHD